jgi:hypothetical protein
MQPSVAAGMPLSESLPKHIEDASLKQAPEDVPVGSGGLIALIPWSGGRSSSEVQDAKPITLGELSAAAAFAGVSLGREHDFHGKVEVEPLALPVRASVNESAPTAQSVASVSSPREIRRNRILSNLTTADNALENDSSRVVQVREVLASTIESDRLYDTVRRLGMGGDRLTLKF